MSSKFISSFKDPIKLDHSFFIKYLFECVTITIKFSMTSSVNRLVAQLNIYLVNISNFPYDSFPIKHKKFIW